MEVLLIEKLYQMWERFITNNEAPVVIPIKFRPVLYLRSEVKITGGSGTVDDMYTLGL